MEELRRAEQEKSQTLRQKVIAELEKITTVQAQRLLRKLCGQVVRREPSRCACGAEPTLGYASCEPCRTHARLYRRRQRMAY